MIRRYAPKGAVAAILTSDWHLREDTPVCRTDNFWETQWKKVDFVTELQRKYDCPVIHAGDLFDFWKPSPYLLSETIKHLPDNFYTVYGQHDLPQHNLELAYKCGIYTLAQAEKLIVLPGCHWNKIPDKDCFHLLNERSKILVWHVMNYVGTPPYPDAPNPSHTLLKKYPEYDLILTGDNHQTFTAQLEGRLLVNPGSLTRQSANQVNHLPCVFLWWAEENKVEAVYLPIENNVVSRDHIQKQEQRNGRIDAFISQLNTDYKATMSFEQNLKIFQETNLVRQSVMDIVYEAISN